MALTRKWLTAMGIEADKIDEIIAANAESLEGVKADRDKYKAEAEKYKADAEKLPDVQKELDSLKAAKDSDSSYKEKYEKEKADFEAFKKDTTAKETKAKKQEAYRTLLKEAGVSEKHISQLMKASAEEIESVEFGDDGKVKDQDKQIESIQKEWSDFITSTGTQGASTSNPPGNNGGNKLSADAEYARTRFAQRYADRYGADPNSQNDNGGKE